MEAVLTDGEFEGMRITDVMVEDIGEGSDTCCRAATAGSGTYTHQAASPLMAHRAP
ncbi:hypothetical protein ACFC96_12445 [Streptomyces sp. NPDC055955]|uniref:hypothetical protein n=1 Tax=Streptomyces sp. NPDC055955 TaxID=3345665 RepID=UPI0035E2C255